jgi:hypothetical protein
VAPRQPDEIESPREVGPSALPDHNGAADQRDQSTDPMRALPSAEIDLPEGGTRAVEAGGVEFESRLVIPCKIGYNAWDVLH